MNYDIFNGDADGICALIQCRLGQPLAAKLITGIKRDIQLLNHISAGPEDYLTVLDISLQKNIAQVKKFLATGAHIFYVDHHQADEIPQHPHLHALIDTSSNQCTSLLVNQHIQGKFALWAVVAAFGDNITPAAIELAQSLALNANDVQRLQQFGIYLNYNSYGDSIADLHFDPEQLYQKLLPYPSPLDFITLHQDIFQQLEAAYHSDMSQALSLPPNYTNATVELLILPDQPWARRVQGVLGNALANAAPEKAHAILSPIGTTAYQVSVRAPLKHKVNADILCSAFPTGGGRQGAAGINNLPIEKLELFIQKFKAIYS